MKIALLSWESLHSIAVGGVAQHVTELAAAMERRGHEVHVFVRIGHGQKNYEVIHGVHYHRCPIQLHHDFVTEMNNMCNAFMWFMGEVEAKTGPFDIVHGHDWMCAKGIVQAKNDRKRSTVFTIHSTEFGRCGNVHCNGQSARVRAFEAEGAFCADRVITVSGVLADEVRDVYQVPDAKLRAIHNGVQAAHFNIQVDPGAVRREYGVGPLDPMILFVGRLCFQKGPDILIEAIPGILRSRGDAKFIFVGEGNMRGQIEHRARQLGITHAVRFPGSRSGVSLAKLYRSCDAVCMPSRNEPFGIVLLEGWAAHKPVIATRNGGPREIITHGLNGFIVDATSESVSWGVHEVFRDFEHARWMGSLGYDEAVEVYSWDSIAQQTEEVYREVAPAQKSARSSLMIQSIISGSRETRSEVEKIFTPVKDKEESLQTAEAGPEQ